MKQVIKAGCSLSADCLV